MTNYLKNSDLMGTGDSKPDCEPPLSNFASV